MFISADASPTRMKTMTNIKFALKISSEHFAAMFVFCVLFANFALRCFFALVLNFGKLK